MKRKHNVTNSICEDGYCDYYGFGKIGCKIKSSATVETFDNLIANSVIPSDCPRCYRLQIDTLVEQRKVHTKAL